MAQLIKKIKSTVKEVIGLRYSVRPMVDSTIYDSIDKSFTGGSLSYSNVLWVVNDKEFEKSINTANRNENIMHSSLVQIEETGVISESLCDTSDDMIGPYEHIINVLRFGSIQNQAINQLDFEKDKVMRTLYLLLHVESNYLKKHISNSTISTLIYFDKEMEAERDAISKFVSGLGRNVLLEHNVICNAVFSNNSIPVSEAMSSVLFLSSKYGYGLAGEVINLK